MNNELPIEIKKIIENSVLPYELLSDYSSFDKEKLSKYKLVENHMSFDYYSQDDKDMILSFMGFPNDESTPKLCTIKVVDNQYNVLGLRVGEQQENLGEILSKHGYESLETTYTCCYKNGKVSITFEFNATSFEDVPIKSIKIDISPEYSGNNLY